MKTSIAILSYFITLLTGMHTSVVAITDDDDDDDDEEQHSYHPGSIARDAQSNRDLVVVSYYSHNDPENTLLVQSMEKEGLNLDTLVVGTGKHLWVKTDTNNYAPELTRGWMFRLRLTVQEIRAEYERRGYQDYIALVLDAQDVYMSQTMESYQEIKLRYLEQYQAKIVFPGQVYCCNPWELRSVARRDWDKHYNTTTTDGRSPSIYKHLNAGSFIGYASAILRMADEMEIWHKTYHSADAYEALINTPAFDMLHMSDIEVDDDEWQIAAWHMLDQQKKDPMSVIDTNQDLFAVTHTFRAREINGEFFKIFR